MRVITGIFCFLCLVNSAFGQDTAIRKIDSTKHAQSFRIRDQATIISDGPLIIIDNKLKDKSSSKHILEKIKPSDILKVSVLKDASAMALYGSEGANGVIIITTKQYATTIYQNNLSLFSKPYKNYLETNKNDDSNLAYVINGEPLERKENGNYIKKLYDIPLKKIKSVTFMNKYYKEILNNSKPLILITTKQ